MNKRVTLKLRRRILAFVIAFVLVMTSIVTIPELGMKTQAADGTMSYVVTISGGTGAVVSDEFTMPSNSEYKTSLTYKGNKLVRLKRDAITDDTLRFKQWNVLVEYKSVNTQSYATANIASYETVLTDNFFRGDDPMKLKARERTVLANELENPVANWEVACIVTITAELENKYAAISFDGNGATSGSMEGTSIEKDTKYTLPTCGFTKERCQFNGWMLGDTVYQPGAEVTITKDTTFTATWLELYATVSFEGNGATSGTQDAVFVEKGTAYALPACSFTKSGYQFAGWKLDDSHVYQTGDEITITENVTFTALWEELFDITLSANPSGYGTVTGEGSFVADKTVTAKATPGVGYMFINWTEDGGVVSEDSEYTFTVSKDRDLVANFATKCAIGFNGDGGSGSMETIYVAEGSSYTLPECGFGSPAEWKYFAGWNWGKPGDVITITTNIVLVARWEYKTYPVTIIVDPEGMGTVEGARYYKKDERVRAVAYPNPGFEFDHWEITGEDETITDDVYVFEMPAHAVEMKAVFKRVAYPVHFAANGGTGSMRDVYVNIDGTYTLPSSNFREPDHYMFDSWKCVVNGATVGNFKPGDEITVTDETTLYAKWKPRTYSIYTSFTGNGTTEGSDDSGTYMCEATVRATADEHWHFVNWQDAYNEYAVVSTDPVYTFTVTDTVYLFAEFELDTNPVSYDANGGSGAMLSDQVGYGLYHTLPECAFTPPEGKKFGWWEKDGNQYFPEQGFGIYGPVTVKAVWINDLEPIEISEANFPDANFRRVLESTSYDKDEDGFLSALEIASITEMWAYEEEIKDLTGIGYFTELKILHCYNNELTSLDLSGLEKLEGLDCSYNPITSLSLTGNPSLLALDARECHYLSNLNLTANTELKILWITTDYALESIDLSHNMKLEEVDIRYLNQPTSIDLSGHDKLEALYCDNCTNVESLKLTGCTALKSLSVNYMYALTELDLSALNALEELRARGMNAMTSMTYKNLGALKKLDISAALTSLTLSNLPNLEELSVTGTELTILDVSNLTKLEKLSIPSNPKLESITFGSVAANLKELNVNYDKALTVNFASFTSLEKLFCVNCGLTTLDVHKLTKLCSLTCRDNKLTSLNVDGLADLDLIDCRYNQLKSLDISSSPKLVANPGLYVLRDSSVTLITDQPYDGNLKFKTVNVLLRDNLAINFNALKTQFAGEGYDEPYVVFKFDGKETIAHVNPIRSDDTYYAFTCGDISPQQLGDDITGTLYVMKDGQLVKGMTLTYSVQKYCETSLKNATAKNTLNTLLVDLLNYGAAAQEYVDYKTDNLVNAKLTVTQKGWATDGRTYDSVYAPVGEAAMTDARFKNVGLVLSETVAIRYGFRAPNGVSGVTLKVEDEKGN
ncbi:MAG: InlB B-repeat-containing protein, partial [Lachnospiraceae bacterium]|nr:InlB B-repeat-containing protein [Lachnospiraceae bacterium]